MNHFKYVGAMPMMNKLPKEFHLSVHGGFLEAAQNDLPEARLYEIRFNEVYVPLYKRLVAANTKAFPKSMMEKRDAHIEEADKCFTLINQNITIRTKENDDATIISDANMLKDIIFPYKSSTIKSIKGKITKYRNLIEKLAEHLDLLNALNIKHLYDKLISETENADNASNEIILINAKNQEFRLTDIRPQIDTAYRNSIDYLNNRWAVEGDNFDCKEFMLNWSKNVEEYKNQYATTEGLRLFAKEKRVVENEETEVIENDKKNKKYYTLPKSRNVRFVNVNAGRMIPENEVVIEKYPNAREWTNMIDVDEFKLGDICFVIIDGKKKYYKMIDESNFNLKPYGEEGYLGWEEVE